MSLAVLMCVASPLVVGSGGVDWPDESVLNASGSCFTAGGDGSSRLSDLGSVEATGPSERDVKAELTMIRAAFGVNISQLAEVLLVKRQTVYAWLDGRANLQRAKRARLDEVLSLAKSWVGRSSVSLRAYLDVRLSGSVSLLELLSEPELRPQEIERVFEESLRAILVKQRIVVARQSLTGLQSPEDQQRAVDLESGKRISQE